MKTIIIIGWDDCVVAAFPNLSVAISQIDKYAKRYGGTAINIAEAEEGELYQQGKLCIMTIGDNDVYWWWTCIEYTPK